MSTSPTDFEFASFNPDLSALFPNPPPLPSSAELFSTAETTDLLGFLDNFSDLTWDFTTTDLISHQDPLAYNDHLPSVPHTLTPYSNPHLNTAPEPSTSTRPKPNPRTSSARGSLHSSAPPSEEPKATPDPNSMGGSPRQANGSTSSAPRPKPLLSTPQKRLNHIMSEQKRRNAIRDGYAQLIGLLAPAGSAPALAMPTRGRPKGSGSRGKGHSKGKSGVLFRAVEYCRWLEEGRDALREEVLRVESAAGIRS